jgi:tetratricopeptide (TPR) repeat protein
MMKTATRNSWSTAVLIILFAVSSLAQSSDADKLWLQISQEDNDTSRIKLLIQFGLNYAGNDSLASVLLKEAYDLSVKNKYRYGIAYGQYYDVLKLWQEGRIDQAIDKGKQCIEAIDSLHLVVGSPLVNIRFLFNLAGRQEERFNFYTEKAAYYKSHGPPENLAVCYHAIAGYYYYLSDYDKAIEYFMRVRDVVEPIDPGFYAGELQVIGSMYMEWGNLDRAEECLLSGKRDLDRLNLSINRFFYHFKLGEIYFKRHDYKQALYYFY